MVGDICNVDWLSEQLLLTADDAGGTTAAVPEDVDESSARLSPSATHFNDHAEQRGEQVSSTDLPPSSPGLQHHQLQHQQSAPSGISVTGCCPNCPYDRRRRVVILDCRSPTDYLASHIIGAVHLAVPQLMLRRLTTGNLPASAVIGCLQDEGRETFNSRWKSEIIVLHDESSHDVHSDVTSSSSLPTSSHVVSVLLRRLKEDGCRVCLLEGGYEAFSRKYPQLCVSASSTSSGTCCTSSGIDSLDNDDGINVDEDDEDAFIDDPCGDGGQPCAIPSSCSSAPPISSTTTTALGLQRLRLHRHARQHRHVMGHRLAQQQFYHHHNSHHHHHHPAGSCNDRFSCPSSLSSSSLSSCCSSANSSNSSSASSSSLSISSCPMMQQQTSTAAASFPVEVLPYLYLGNARSSADIEALHRNGIRYILNVTPDVPNSFAGTDAFHYLQIPIDDHWSQDLTSYFPNAIAFIDEARRNRCGVLVHCLAGVSRSVTVTVAYLMHALRLSLNDAFEHVRRCKPDISPNFSFMGQLLDYERLLSAERDLQTVSGECVTSSTNHAADPSQSSVADDDDGGVQPLAAIAEPVGDQSMFLSPPAATRPRHHRSQQQQQQHQQPSDSAGCQCTTTNSSQVGVEGSKSHCDVCCRRVVDGGSIEVRMSPDLSRSVLGVHAVNGGESSCYSSPVSSLSSLSSSSAANAAVSSTSSSSSSAFDYDSIPMSSSPSPMTHFS